MSSYPHPNIGGVFRAAKNPSPSEASGDGIIRTPKIAMLQSDRCAVSAKSQRDLAHRRRALCQLAYSIVVVLMLIAPARRAAADNFADGTAAARAGDFSTAAAAFKKSVSAQPSSGALVNLGIAEWQSGRAGAALLAWEQASWLNPQDAAAKQNLKFARQAAQVDAPELRWFETASTWLPPMAWIWLAGAGLWLAGGALVLPRVFRRPKSGGAQALAALGVCLFIFALTVNIGVVSRTDIGFVVKKNAVLRLTPTSGSEVLAALPAGEPLRRLKTRGNYFFVRTPMASGWIERGQVGLIVPE